MSKISREIEFTDKKGKNTRKFFNSGLVETALVASQWYKDNIQKPMQEQVRERKKEMERSNKLSEKMRKIAEEALQKFQCLECSYIYDPEVGDPSQEIPENFSFKYLPKDWLCPQCGAAKNKFKKYSSPT